MNILLIEDDGVLADGLIHTLANSGYTGFILDETGTPANPKLS
jgi:DNA-binding response OmpR family regulator